MQHSVHFSVKNRKYCAKDGIRNHVSATKYFPERITEQLVSVLRTVILVSPSGHRQQCPSFEREQKSQIV